MYELFLRAEDTKKRKRIRVEDTAKNVDAGTEKPRRNGSRSN